MTNMDDRKDGSKSAPANGRRQSSSEQKKNSTMKEINTWINKDSGDPLKRSTSRHVSQLTENVTEERMLIARQLELGRERYKFLVSHEYEKQKFVERQTVKEKMMKKYMSSARKIIDKSCTDKPKKTLTIRIPQVEFLSQSSTPTVEEQHERLESRASKTSTGNRSVKRAESGMPRLETRTATRLVSKGEKNEKRPRTRGSSSVPNSRRAPKEITFVDYSRPDSRVLKEAKDSAKSEKTNISGNATNGVYVNTSTNSNDPNNSETIDKEGRLPSVANPCNRRSVGPERSVSRLSTRSRSSASAKQGKQTSDGRPLSRQKSLASFAEVTPKWSKKKEFKFGEKFGSSITDPRYVALEKTLTPADFSVQPAADVKDIIAKNYVLRTSSKCESAASAKLMHAKFIALILEKELAVE